MAIPIRPRQIAFEKPCSTCKSVKPISEFHRNSGNWDGLTTACKECAKQTARAWSRNNRERANGTQRQWRARRHWREYTPERGPRGTIRRDAKAVAAQGREALAESTGIPLGVCQCGCGRATQQATVTQTRTLRLAGQPNLYLRGHRPTRDTPRLTRGRRRLKGDSLTWLDVLLADPCAYCGGATDTVDHIVPSVRGGAHEWDNLTAACMSCNGAKAQRSLLRFMWKRVA